MTSCNDGVREATRGELDAVLKLDAILRSDFHVSGGDDRKTLLIQYIEAGECLVYVNQSNISGFIVVRSRLFFGHDFVELIAVAPDVRRAGIASILLRAAVSRSRTPDFFISTNRSNAPMRSLISKEGWQFSGELDGLDEGDPELVFHIGSR